MTTARKQSTKSSRPATQSRSSSSDDQYTKPELRDRVKKKVLAGSKGGRPGQWSARKAQLVAAEYERSGGSYKHPRNETQQHLHEWTEEHWKTADGKPAERGAVMKRYLPAEAWKKLTPEQRKATDQKKVEGSRQGKQFVANTPAAASARRTATARRSKSESHTTASGAAKRSPARPRSGTGKSA